MNLNNKNEFRNSIKKRNYFALFIFLSVFAFLSVRFAYLHLTEGPQLAVSANSQYYYEEYTNNLNFKLLDNEGQNLFNFVSKYYVVVDPMTFYTLNEEDTLIDMRKVLYILRNYDKDYDISELQSELDSGSVKYEVDKETHDKIKSLNNVKGVYSYEYDEYDRGKNSNIKNVLSTPIRYDNSEMKDAGSLEMKIYNYVKDNKKDRIRFEKDVSGNIVSEDNIIEEDNRNIKTTLDKEVQKAVEEVLRLEEYEDYEQISAVLMESSTGRILAMAQKDDEGINSNIGFGNPDGYLIGSIFKTIVYEAAFEKELISEDKIFDITNEKAFPKSKEKAMQYTIDEAYIASSNRAFKQIGEIVGADNMYRLAKVQGLFDPVLGLHGEAVGKFEGYDEGQSIDITNASVGQKTSGTPLSVLSIANTVVNNGIYVKPQIIESVIKDNGTVVEEFSIYSNRVINEYTANVMKRDMISVVEDQRLGTGGAAQIKGVEIGGKTGTTEYIDGKKELSDAWFNGFFKYNDKYYTMTIYIPNSTKVEEMSSSTACNVFKNVVEEITKNMLLD